MIFRSSFSNLLMLLLVADVAFASETYRDYEDEADHRNLENLREFYRILLRRNSMEMAGIPHEHLMIRKSQRSPSLRLRFGRSKPMLPGILARPDSKEEAFDDN